MMLTHGWLCCLVWAAGAMQLGVPAGGEYRAYSMTRQLSEKENQELLEMLARWKAHRLRDGVLDHAGLILLGPVDERAARRLDEFAKGSGVLKPVSVRTMARSVEIIAARYLVHPKPGADEKKLESLLVENGFEVVERPTWYQDFFLVQRTRDASQLARELEELRAMPGVVMTEPQTFLKNRPTAGSSR